MANIVQPNAANTPYVFTTSERHTLGFGLAVVTYVALYASGILPKAWQIACPSNTILALQCPGCGLSRAGSALAHGDLLQALRLNPIVPWIASYFAYRFLAIFYGIYTSKYLIQHIPKRVQNLYIVTFLGSVILTWTLRIFSWFGNF
jgi:hypothetical protein